MILKSWKTTLLGVMSLFVAAMATYMDVTWAEAVKDPRVQQAVLVGLIGLLSKDWNVTGGDSGQPSTYKALDDANQHPSVSNPPEVKESKE